MTGIRSNGAAASSSATYWQVTGHAAVRAAAKDWPQYSSDLLGDRDVRNYRQLPLEADPPRHGLFRDALQPLFTRDAVEQHSPQFRHLARSLVDGLTARGGGDVVADLALPYVVGCLTIVFNRPNDYSEWLSWGPDVWTADAYATRWVSTESGRDGAHDPIRSRERSGATLHTYLTRVLDDARARRGQEPQSGLDIWDRIARLQVDGESISAEEMLGIGSVLLAGGRDTVIKLIAGIVWRLIDNADDRAYLSAHADARDAAIAEFARYLSPLPRIERVHEPSASTDEKASQPSLGVLDFASANHDKTIWSDPEHLDIRRSREPHLAFGFGRHSCLGMSLAQAEAAAFLDVLLNPWPGWHFAAEPQIDWVSVGSDEPADKILGEFRYLPVLARSL